MEKRSVLVGVQVIHSNDKKRLLVEIQKHDVKERLFGLSQKKEASKEEFRIERLVVSITCVGRRSRAHFG